MIKDIHKNADAKMKKSLENLASQLDTLRAGRANPRILDRIEVDYYGSMVPLNQVGNISVPEPRMLVITPWEKPMLKVIEKEIQKSDLGMNPVNDGQVIRLIVPELTEETRKNLVKQVKKHGEDTKVAIRSIRRDSIEKIKDLKHQDVSEDDIKKGEEDIQKLTDQFIARIEKAVDDKEAEVMTI